MSNEPNSAKLLEFMKDGKVKFSCTRCEKRMTAPPKYYRRTVSCSNCNCDLVVPSPMDDARSAPVKVSEEQKQQTEVQKIPAREKRGLSAPVLAVLVLLVLSVVCLAGLRLFGAESDSAKTNAPTAELDAMLARIEKLEKQVRTSKAITKDDPEPRTNVTESAESSEVMTELKVRRLVVVDAAGNERVVIGDLEVPHSSAFGMKVTGTRVGRSVSVGVSAPVADALGNEGMLGFETASDERYELTGIWHTDQHGKPFSSQLAIADTKEPDLFRFTTLDFGKKKSRGGEKHIIINPHLGIVMTETYDIPQAMVGGKKGTCTLRIEADRFRGRHHNEIHAYNWLDLSTGRDGATECFLKGAGGSIHLKSNDDGENGLYLEDTDGKTKARLSCNNKFGALAVTTEKGELYAGQNRAGGPSLHLLDENGNSKLSMGSIPSGGYVSVSGTVNVTGTVYVNAKDGYTVIGENGAGGPTVGMVDGSGQQRVKIGIVEEMGYSYVDNSIRPQKPTKRGAAKRETEEDDTKTAPPETGKKKRKRKPEFVGGGYAGDTDDHYLKQNIGKGSYLYLDDGSLWKVDSSDKFSCSLWLSFADVYLKQTGSDYVNFRIYNDSDNESVKAKYIPNSKKSTIRLVVKGGEDILLTNNTRWKAKFGQANTSRFWKADDQIYIDDSGSRKYLVNVSRSEFIEVTKSK